MITKEFNLTVKPNKVDLEFPTPDKADEFLQDALFVKAAGTAFLTCLKRQGSTLTFERK